MSARALAILSGALCLWALVPAGGLVAEDGPAREGPWIAVEPAGVRAGEAAVARYTLPPQGDPRIIEAAEEELPQAPQLGLRRLRAEVDAEATRIELSFVAWAAGELGLPAFSLRGLRVPAARIRIASVLGAGAAEGFAPAPPEPPSALPGAALDIALTAALAVGGAGLCVLVLTAGRALVLRLVEAYRQGLPPKRFLRALAALEKGPADLSDAAFYDAVAAALRPFLGWVAGRDFGPLTSPEMLGALAGAGRQDLRSSLAPLLDRADAARFAGSLAGPDSRAADLAGLRLLAEGVDAEAERADGREGGRAAAGEPGR